MATKRKNKKPAKKRVVLKARGSKVLKFPMKFGGLLLAEFRTTYAELREVESRLEIVRRDTFAEQQLPKYKPLLELLHKRDEVEKERHEFGQHFQAAVQKIAARFKIPIEKMQDYAINDKTGVVTYSPSKESEVGGGLKAKTVKRNTKKGLKKNG